MLSDAKIDSLRSDTPGCAERRHFNHAGASLPPRRVTEAIVGYLMLESTRGPMEAAALVTDELAMLRTNASRFIGAEEGEVTDDSRLHPIVEDLPRGAADRLECRRMASKDGRQVLVHDEASPDEPAAHRAGNPSQPYSHRHSRVP